MNRQAIIERTFAVISQLPTEKIQEISDFADFIISRHEELQLTKGIQRMTEDSRSFDFLNHEDDLYTEADLKEVYND